MSGQIAQVRRILRIPEWTFADRLRKIRRDEDAEQREFADLLGVKWQAYAAWEAGRNRPRSIEGVAKRIEAVTGVPAAWVLWGDGERHAPDVTPIDMQDVHGEATVGSQRTYRSKPG